MLCGADVAVFVQLPFKANLIDTKVLRIASFVPAAYLYLLCEESLLKTLSTLSLTWQAGTPGADAASQEHLWFISAVNVYQKWWSCKCEAYDLQCAAGVICTCSINPSAPAYTHIHHSLAAPEALHSLQVHGRAEPYVVSQGCLTSGSARQV